MLFDDTGHTEMPAEPENINAAARCGNLESVMKLREEGHPIDMRDNRGWRPIHEAAHGNFPDVLQFLIKQGSDVKWVNHDRKTALHLACEQGHVECTRILLQNKASINSKDHERCRPLYAAVRSGSVEVVRLLLEHGASVDCRKFSNTTPLLRAITDGHVEITRLLLRQGASLTVTDEYDMGPLHYCAQNGRTECMEVMLQHIRDTGEGVKAINARTEDDDTPLCIAAQYGHLECVKLLLSYGAKANRHAPPLLPAVEHNRIKIVKLLTLHTSQKFLDGCSVSVFHLSCVHDDTECTKLLIQAYDVNKRSYFPEPNEYLPIFDLSPQQVIYDDKVTPLTMSAYLDGPLSHVQLMIDSGAYINPRYYRELPAMISAIHNRRGDLIKLLIRNGASLNLYHPQLSGNTTILCAIHVWEDLDLVLKCGAEAESLFSRKSRSVRDDRDPVPFWELLYRSRDILPQTGVTTTKVIQKLMYFVANVSLDVHLLRVVDSEDWDALVNMQDTPRSLAHLSRLAIRAQFSPSQLLSDSLSLLPLPAPILNYLNYSDITLTADPVPKRRPVRDIPLPTPPPFRHFGALPSQDTDDNQDSNIE